MDKSALSFSGEFGQQVLERVAAGQSPEDMAKHFGRTPQTIRRWLTSAGEKASARAPAPDLLQRASVLGNELVASLFSWREARYAAQVSRELLKLYWIVMASHPGLERRETYQKVVMARTGADMDDAAAVLMRAEQSFAHWPTERDLTFRDVVHYLAVSEYLAVDDRMATRIDMGRLVAGRIPQDL